MHAIYENGRIAIYDAYLYREVIKEMQGRYWDPERKVWTVPFKPENISTLKVIGCELKGVLVDMITGHSRNRDKPQILAEPVEPMPIRVKPYQHQVQAYNFVGNLLGLFAGGGAA